MNPTLLHALIYAGAGLFTLGVVASGTLLKGFDADESVPAVLVAVLTSAFWPLYWLYCFIAFNRKP